MGAMYLDLFSVPINRKAQKPNYSTTTTTSTTEEGFPTMFSDLCGLFKPFGKEYEV